MSDEDKLRDAIQIAIVADDPITALRKIEASGMWLAFATFVHALRALRVDENSSLASSIAIVEDNFFMFDANMLCGGDACRSAPPSRWFNRRTRKDLPPTPRGRAFCLLITRAHAIRYGTAVRAFKARSPIVGGSPLATRFVTVHRRDESFVMGTPPVEDVAGPSAQLACARREEVGAPCSRRRKARQRSDAHTPHETNDYVMYARLSMFKRRLSLLGA